VVDVPGFAEYIIARKLENYLISRAFNAWAILGSNSTPGVTSGEKGDVCCSWVLSGSLRCAQ